MISALARFARPLPVFAASLALVAGLAGGLGALVSGFAMPALVPVMVAGLAVIAAALNGIAVMPVLAALSRWPGSAPRALFCCGVSSARQGVRARCIRLLFCRRRP